MEIDIYYDEDGNPVGADKYYELWSNRWQIYTEYGGIDVSTVFLGIDHSFMEGGPPLLFETMIFGGERDGEQMRYATKSEAIAGHNQAVSEAIGAHVLVDGGWRPVLGSEHS